MGDRVHRQVFLLYLRSGYDEDKINEKLLCKALLVPLIVGKVL